jgi:hypothetical protein
MKKLEQIGCCADVMSDGVTLSAFSVQLQVVAVWRNILWQKKNVLTMGMRLKDGRRPKHHGLEANLR